MAMSHGTDFMVTKLQWHLSAMSIRRIWWRIFFWHHFNLYRCHDSNMIDCWKNAEVKSDLISLPSDTSLQGFNSWHGFRDHSGFSTKNQRCWFSAVKSAPWDFTFCETKVSLFDYHRDSDLHVTRRWIIPTSQCAVLLYYVFLFLRVIVRL